MATITLKGNPIHTNGDLPKTGSLAPDFALVDTDLNTISLGTYQGKKKLLNIFPSMDTPVCALSTKKFNAETSKHPDTAFLMISADLPFAMKRFCTAEGADGVISLSLMRDKKFAQDYGVLITDGPLAGITARAIVVLDTENRVLYSQLVSEIAEEPDYEQALACLK
jgi:thiol peroxidase